METTKAVRQSNFELLRIICMLFLIAHHCCVHGGILNTDSPYKFFALIFLPVGKICFVAFVALSMWFLCEKPFKSSRFVKTWLEVFFYSVVFSLISFIFLPRSKLGMIRGVLSSLLPIAGNSHGFAATYLLFYLLLPYIKKTVDVLNKKQLGFLIVILFYVQILEQIICKFTGWTQRIFSHPQLFLFCYATLLYLKRYPVHFFDNKICTLFTVSIVWIYVYVTNYLAIQHPENKYLNFIVNLTVDENSLLYVLAGFCLFFLFKNTKIHQSSFINKIATFTFGVLLIHDHQFFRYALWQKIVRTQDWYYSDWFIHIFAITTLSVFVVCAFIDFLRQICLERFILKSKLINRVNLRISIILENV